MYAHENEQSEKLNEKVQKRKSFQGAAGLGVKREGPSTVLQNATCQG